MEKKFEAEPCSVSQSFVYQRSFCIKVGYHEFPSISLSLSIESFCTGTPQCFKNFRVSRSFMHKKWVSRISLEYFSSHSAEFFNTGTLQCFRKLRVSKNFMHKKWISRISVEIFSSHSAEFSYGNPSVFQKVAVIEKLYA